MLRASLIGAGVLSASVLLLILTSCPVRAQSDSRHSTTQSDIRDSAADIRDSAAASEHLQNRLLVMGDSLAAEYGLKRGSGWVAMVAAQVAQSGKSFTEEPGAATVVNASISGETTAGGDTRLPALLSSHRPAVVLIALGSNDALRGLDLKGTEANLTRMIETSRAAGAKVILAGMQLPPNYGRVYAERFASLYHNLAQKQGAVLVPFLLAGVAEDLSRFQLDRIHPNESAQQQIFNNVWPAVDGLTRTTR